MIRSVTDTTDHHEYTYVPGRLGIIDAELRAYIGRLASSGSWPDALRIELGQGVGRGPYRDAPAARRDAFEGFEYRESFPLARRHRESFTTHPAVAEWRYDAHAVPVLLLGYGAFGWSRVLGLVAITGRAQVIEPDDDSIMTS